MVFYDSGQAACVLIRCTILKRRLERTAADLLVSPEYYEVSKRKPEQNYP